MKSTLIEFCKQKKIIGLSVIMSAMTFGFISKSVTLIYNPVFDSLFPKNKLEDIVIILPNKSRVEIGFFILELIRWMLYMVITFQVLGSILGDSVIQQFD